MYRISGSIYIVTCLPTGLQYIGQAKDKKTKNGKPYNYGPKGRWSDHCSSSKMKKTPLADAITEYGSDNFKIEILESAPSERLDELEAKWIKHYNTIVPFGLNVATHSRSKHNYTTTVQNHYNSIASSAEIRPIKRNGINRIVYLSLTLKDGTRQRITFGQGADCTFEDAVNDAREFIKDFKCPITDLIELDEIERRQLLLKDKLAICARITTASSLIAVYVTVADIEWQNKEIRVCFGGKHIPMEEAYLKALAYVKELGCSYIDTIPQSSQQVDAIQVVAHT